MRISASSGFIAALDDDYSVVRSRPWLADLFSTHDGQELVTASPDAGTARDQHLTSSAAEFGTGDFLISNAGDLFLIGPADPDLDRSTRVSGLLAHHGFEDVAAWGSGMAALIAESGEPALWPVWDPGHLSGPSPHLPLPLLTGDGAEGPQVLPGVSDDDFLLGKDGDVPLVLPGGDDLDRGLLGLDLADQPVQLIDHMISLDESGFLLGPTDDLGRLHDHDGWLF